MRKDRLNHNAENYRTAMPVFLVALFGMIAYLFINVNDLSAVKIVILAFGIVAVAVILVVLTLRNLKDLNELEEL